MFVITLTIIVLLDIIWASFTEKIKKKSGFNILKDEMTPELLAEF